MFWFISKWPNIVLIHLMKNLHSSEFFNPIIIYFLNAPCSLNYIFFFQCSCWSCFRLQYQHWWSNQRWVFLLGLEFSCQTECHHLWQGIHKPKMVYHRLCITYDFHLSIFWNSNASVFLPHLFSVLLWYRSSDACPATKFTTCVSWRNIPAKSASVIQTQSRPKKSWRLSEGCWFTSPWSSCVRRTCCLHWALKRAWLLWGCGHNRNSSQIRPLRNS